MPLSVKSREIVWAFMEQVRVSLEPLHHCRHRCLSPERSLGQLMIVQPHVAREGAFKVFAADEAVTSEHLFDAAIEAFRHPIGLGSSRTGEPVYDAQRLAQHLPNRDGVTPAGLPGRKRPASGTGPVIWRRQ